MSDAPAKSLVLIDGSGYIFRAFFALPPMTRPDGTPVNAVFGFANMLFRLMQDRPHDDLVVVFDYSGESFRNQLYDQGQPRRAAEGTRSPVCAGARGRPRLRPAGDRRRGLRGRRPDRRLRQACQGRRRTRDGGLVRQGPDAAGRRRGRDVGPDEAEGHRARRGDRAVRRRAGAGLRRPGADRRHLRQRAGRARHRPQECRPAAAEFGSLEGLLANLDRIKQPKRREVAAGQRRQGAPVLPPGLPRPTTRRSRSAWTSCAASPSTRRPCSPVPARQRLQVARRAASARSPPQPRSAAPSAPRRASSARLAASPRLERARRLLARAVELGLLAIDTETTSLDIWRARLVGVCLAVEPGEGFYVPIAHVDEFGQPRDGQLDLQAVIERLRPVLADPSVLKIGHNLKYDAGRPRPLRHRPRPRSTTPCCSPTRSTAPATATAWTSSPSATSTTTASAYESVCRQRARPRSASPSVPVDKATAYAAEHAEVTLRLWQHLQAAPARRAHGPASTRPSSARCSPCSPAMERSGIRVDAPPSAPALRRVRPAHGRARGRGPQARRPAASTWARPSSSARSCSTR